MPIWNQAEVPSSIPFQQSQGEAPRWSLDVLMERWAHEERSAYPELGEVTEGMMSELDNFNKASWLGRWDVVSLASMAEGSARLAEAGWDLKKITFESAPGGEIGIWIAF